MRLRRRNIVARNCLQTGSYDRQKTKLAKRLFPFIEQIFADGGYAGNKMALVVWCKGAWRLRIDRWPWR
jgi:hypothetical protein